VVTDVARVLCCPDEVKFLTRKLEETNKQLAECMQQMTAMTEENSSKQKQLEELEDAARVVVDMVESTEEEAIDNRTLLKRLREAP
jgi:chromosome segregation ATPase